MKFPTFIYILLFLLFSFQAGAQTLCSNAVTITPGTQQCGDTNGNYGQLSSNPCHFYNAQEYWYQITGDGINALQIDLTNIVAPNAGIAAYVFDNCPTNSPVCMGVSVASGSSTSTLSLTTDNALANGVIHYVVIVTSTNSIAFCMDASFVPPPTPPINNECDDAIDIPINLDYTCTTIVSGTIKHATQSMIGCENQPVNDVWYKFTSPHNILYFDLFNKTSENGLSSRLFFELFNQPPGSDQLCGSLVSGYCTDLITYGRMTVNPGVVRYIRISSEYLNADVTFDLCLKKPPPRPANDSCLGAFPLVQHVGSTCPSPTQGDYVTMSTNFYPTCQGSNAAPDIWYSFVAQTSNVLVDINTPYFNPTGELFGGSCGSLVSVACDINNDGKIFGYGLTVGATYLIRMYKSQIYTPGRTSFDICVYGLEVPNDLCSTAEPLPIAQDDCGPLSTGHNFLATNSIDSLIPECGSFQGNDVWYRIDAPASGYVVVDVTSTNHEFVEGALYAGGCTTPQELDCISNFGYPTYGTGWPHRFQDLTPGPYYLRLWDNNNDEFGDFGVCAYEPPPCRITDVSAGLQTCDPNGFTYSQELIITYPEEPPSGMMIINKLSSNPITVTTTGSPQTIMLTNLDVDGYAVGITAEFPDYVGCSWSSNAVFVSPRRLDCLGLPQPFDHCGIYSSENVEAIPENGIGAIDSIVISGSSPEIIADLNVMVDLRLGNLQSYQIFLTSPAGTTVTLASGECYFSDGLNVEFDDEANSSLNCPYSYTTPYGKYSSNYGNLSDFNGESLNGTWIINARSTYPTFASGALARWCLIPNAVEPTICEITGITAGAQTACDPQTNTYTQEVTVTYTDAPTTGSINIAGQFFPASTSPQTETLINLPATGAPVTITAFFAEDQLCTYDEVDLYTAPADCEPLPTASCGPYSSSPGTPINSTVAVLDSITMPVGSGLIFDLNVVLDLQHDRLQNLTIIVTSPAGTEVKFMQYQCYNVDLLVEFDDEATSTVVCQSPVMGDYQPSWGSLSDFDGEVSDGVWTLSISDYSSNYDGVLNQWCLVPILAPSTNCAFNSATAGIQTPCDPATKTYTQEVIITYTDEPSTGLLIVNEQEFAITGSPQTVTLVGLNGNGESQDVVAYFENDPFCYAIIEDVFIAAADCATVCGTYFYDTGGPLDDYSLNEDIVTTFCPDYPGQIITATFFSFEIETDGYGGCYDVFYIYDGVDTNSPTLSPPGGYCEGGGSGGPSLQGGGGGGPTSIGVPINYPITSSDPSGCLTFHFISDGFVNLEGWEALISCSPPPADIQVELRLMLEGPYDVGTALMRDELRTMSLIPEEEPFTGLGFPHVDLGGGETVDTTIFDVTGHDAIVDWIMVELRDALDPSVVIATRSALLQADGDIVDLDGASPVTFANKEAGSYYVSARPRHHLAVMTTMPISLARNSSTVHDFKTGNGYGGPTAFKVMSDGVSVLFEGDLNADGIIDAADRSIAWNNRNLTGYRQDDSSMDGRCDAVERSQTWNNKNKTTQIPGF